MRNVLHASAILIAALATGCSSTSIYVPVAMPMELDLRNADTIGVLVYPSDEAPAWAVPVHPARLTEAFRVPFAADARFSSENVYSDDGQLPLTEPRVTLTKQAIRTLANAAGADMLVYGEVLNLDYNEDVITADVRRFQKADGKQIVRKGLLRLMMHVRVVNSATQEMIWNSVLEHSVRAETSAADAEPAPIDPIPLCMEAAEAIARDVLGRTEPVTQSVLVTFLTDSDYPGIDAAIRKAKSGDWPDALDRFLKIADTGQDSDAEHKLLYNLGLAYQFNHDFRAAKEAFERAYALNDSQRYLIAIDDCLRMEQLYQETVKQQ